MKIQQLVKTEQFVEMEIQLPYFCQLNNTYYKVESEKLAIAVYNGKHHDYWSITKCAVSGYTIDIAKATQITEEQFNEAFYLVKHELEKDVEMKFQ